MADGTYQHIRNADAVPIAQILRTRRTMPRRGQRFELQLCGVNWRNLGALATACDTAGLRLVTVRCHANGRGFCVLADDGSADLERLSDGLLDAPEISGWTTLILF